MKYPEKCYIKVKLPKNHTKADQKNKMLYKEKYYIKILHCIYLFIYLFIPSEIDAAVHAERRWAAQYLWERPGRRRPAGRTGHPHGTCKYTLQFVRTGILLFCC